MKTFLEYYRALYLHNKIWFQRALKFFVFALCIGGIAFFIWPDLILVIAKGFSDRFGDTPALSFSLVLQIFLQNVIVSAIALLGGILLGLGSLVVIFVNGFLIGFVVIAILFNNQLGILQRLALLIGGLVPHGIFEIPAFLVAATLGLRLGWEWMQREAVGQRFAVFKKNLKLGLTQLPAIALVLLIAALIEVFVSGWIVNNL